MKQNKFRVWDLEDQEWMNFGKMPIMNTKKTKSWKFGKDNNCKFMQYIGIKDKHGKEIYEGDIVQGVFVWGVVGGVVTFFESEAAYGVKDSEDMLFLDHIQGIWEIIGNIYENPEMAEE
jgi:uncharacterized phage protein (TIGR01671 family)